MKKSYFNWSGGKDSSLALYDVLQQKTHKVDRLLTTISEKHKRISMHGVRRELLHHQARELGIELKEIILPESPSMDIYNQMMDETMKELHQQGFTHSIFGDIFLEDLRIYREQQVQKAGLQAYFPLWKQDTTELVHRFIDLGFKAITVCVKAELMDQSFAGRIIDHDFLSDLPDNVDPCGENGEFHSFVFDGPVFKNPIPVTTGEIILREYNTPKQDKDDHPVKHEPEKQTTGFWYCDLE